MLDDVTIQSRVPCFKLKFTGDTALQWNFQLLYLCFHGFYSSQHQWAACDTTGVTKHLNATYLQVKKVYFDDEVKIIL